MDKDTQLYEYRKGDGELVVESKVDDFVTRLEPDEINKCDGSVEAYGVSRELVYDSQYLRAVIKVRHKKYIKNRSI